MRAAILLVAGLTACATTADHEKRLAGWIGKSEVDLVRGWGPPSSVYQAGNVKFLSFTEGGIVASPGVAPSYTTSVSGGVARTTPVGGVPPIVANRICVSTFELENDRVTAARYQGRGCGYGPASALN